MAELDEVKFDDQAFHKCVSRVVPLCVRVSCRGLCVVVAHTRAGANLLGRLVLPEEKKVLIRSLVENSADFSDIISGKGGGCIFLLHGSPGVGKVRTTTRHAPHHDTTRTSPHTHHGTRTQRLLTGERRDDRR